VIAPTPEKQSRGATGRRLTAGYGATGLLCFLGPRFIVLAAPANRMIAASPADDMEIAFMRVCGGILAGSRTSETS
jgi:hypothetical protein